MTPQLYLEFDSTLLAARAEEGFGRCYAASESARLPALWPTPVYPQPPEQYNNSPYPTFANGYPPADAFTYFYSRCVPKLGEGAGGVLTLDDMMVSILASQTLSDGSSWSVNLETEAKTYAQLSAAGQAVVPPPEE